MRIITGSARGTKLRAPKGMTTRPTADRIKESLFNILSDIRGTVVLDLFAGSGALGLEALSRGAKAAVFIDKSADSIDIIRANSEHIHLASKADIRRGDAFSLSKLLCCRYGGFDIVFCDPPYHLGLCQKALDELSTVLLKEDGLFIAEIGVGEVLKCPDSLELIREKMYGAVTKINIYKKLKAERKLS